MDIITSAFEMIELNFDIIVLMVICHKVNENFDNWALADSFRGGRVGKRLFVRRNKIFFRKNISFSQI